jgi:hypothetical protein
MAGPLTYPPEIRIESTLELLLESGEEEINYEAWFEVMGLVIEFLVELL